MGIARLPGRHHRNFRRNRLAENHSTSLAQQLCGEGIDGGVPARKLTASVFGRHIERIEDILQRDRHTMQWSHRSSGRSHPVPLPRLCERQIRIKKGPGLNGRLPVLNPVQARSGQTLRGCISIGHFRNRLDGRQFVQGT